MFFDSILCHISRSLERKRWKENYVCRHTSVESIDFFVEIGFVSSWRSYWLLRFDWIALINDVRFVIINRLEFKWIMVLAIIKLPFVIVVSNFKHFGDFFFCLNEFSRGKERQQNNNCIDLNLNAVIMDTRLRFMSCLFTEAKRKRNFYFDLNENEESKKYPKNFASLRWPRRQTRAILRALSKLRLEKWTKRHRRMRWRTKAKKN